MTRQTTPAATHLVPDRFVVQAIVREIDGNGKVVSEKQLEPIAVYGHEALATWAQAFPAKLTELEAETKASSA